MSETVRSSRIEREVLLWLYINTYFDHSVAATVGNQIVTRYKSIEWEGSAHQCDCILYVNVYALTTASGSMKYLVTAKTLFFYLYFIYFYFFTGFTAGISLLPLHFADLKKAFGLECCNWILQVGHVFWNSFCLCWYFDLKCFILKINQIVWLFFKRLPVRANRSAPKIDQTANRSLCGVSGVGPKSTQQTHWNFNLR